MSPRVAVERPDDPRLADYLHLTDADLLRADQNAFIVEGVLAIDRLLASAYPVRSLLVIPAKADRYAHLDAPVYVADQAVMNAVTGFNIHRGALAAATRLPPPPLETLLAPARLVLAVEGVTDIENMGGLFRNAAAFGVDAAVVSPDSCDPLYRRSVRVSLGHVLHVPFTRAPVDPAALRAHGFTTIALTPAPDAERLDDLAAAATDGRVAVLVGTEGTGLRDETLAAADRRVRIPIAEGVDSLNVATAAAIALQYLSRL